MMDHLIVPVSDRLKKLPLEEQLYVCGVLKAMQDTVLPDELKKFHETIGELRFVEIDFALNRFREVHVNIPEAIRVQIEDAISKLKIELEKRDKSRITKTKLGTLFYGEDNNIKNTKLGFLNNLLTAKSLLEAQEMAKTGKEDVLVSHGGKGSTTNKIIDDVLKTDARRLAIDVRHRIK
jgi:hypothetical protein